MRWRKQTRIVDGLLFSARRNRKMKDWNCSHLSFTLPFILFVPVFSLQSISRRAIYHEHFEHLGLLLHNRNYQQCSEKLIWMEMALWISMIFITCWYAREMISTFSLSHSVLCPSVSFSNRRTSSGADSTCFSSIWQDRCWRYFHEGSSSHPFNFGRAPWFSWNRWTEAWSQFASVLSFLVSPCSSLSELLPVGLLSELKLEAGGTAEPNQQKRSAAAKASTSDSTNAAGAARPRSFSNGSEEGEHEADEDRNDPEARQRIKYQQLVQLILESWQRDRWSH